MQIHVIPIGSGLQYGSWILIDRQTNQHDQKHNLVAEIRKCSGLRFFGITALYNVKLMGSKKVPPGE